MGEIVVNHKAIEELGNKIIGLKSLLDTPKADLNAIKLEAGAFPDADDLKRTVDERKNDTLEFLNAIGERLEVDGKKLKETAVLYEQEEKDATIKAEQVLPDK